MKPVCGFSIILDMYFLFLFEIVFVTILKSVFTNVRGRQLFKLPRSLFFLGSKEIKLSSSLLAF